MLHVVGHFNHRGYRGFQVGLIHSPIDPTTYDLRFWSLGGSIPLLPKRPILPPPKGPLPPMLKDPPTPLLVGTFHPLGGNPTPSPIRDGLPLRSLYGLMIGIIRGILGLCFFGKNHRPHPKAPYDLL